MTRENSGTPAVSVLVPVYNAQDYLRECLDSLVGQTLADMEFICIDDGSTDSSSDILADYARADGRVRVMTKANSGYGDSMNRGIAAARGEWVGICEPDDFCDRRMYESLLRVGRRQGCDLVKSNYYSHAEGAGPDELVRILDGFRYGRPFDPRSLPRIMLSAPAVWTGLYRRDWLVGAGIRFSATPGASFQDTSFGHRCWVNARSVVLVRQGYYHYRLDNAASSSNSGAKLYAVCDEFDGTVDYLLARGDGLLDVFGPYLTVARHSAYRWNYNRVFAELKPEFARRWERDMVRAYDAGILDPALMTREFRSLLWHVLEGAEAFCARYPGEIPEMPVL